ncbi:MAG: response regulator [Deltaproteobacteria bacterium]|nr:response regulator [Deltaproteobacteria bacterium]
MTLSVLQLVHVGSVGVYLWMAIYVLWRAPRMQRSIGFAGIAICFAWWSASLILAHDPHVPRSEAALAYDLGAVAWASFASFSLWFALAFVGRRALLAARWLRPALAGPPLVIIVAQWRGAVAADYVHESWGWAYVWSASPWTLFFYAYYSAFIALAIGLVHVAGRRSPDKLVRRQCAIIVYTAMVPFIGATTTDIALPWLGIHGVPNIAPAFLLAWAGGMAWAIVKYRLLEISPETAADEILTALSDGVVLVDREDRIVTWNPAATQVFAHAAELRGARMTAVLAARTRAGDATADGDLDLASPSGPRTVALARSEVRDPRGELVGLIYLFRDITERERSARALREARDQLEERVAARTEELATAYRDKQRLHEAVAQSERLAAVGVLAAGVAHEINNPLTYVTLGLHEIQDALERSKDDRAAMLERAREALAGCERIQTIVRELGTFAKHGDDVRAHAITEPIEAAVAMSAHQLRDRATLAVDVTATHPVRADAGRLTQLFLNLLVDAAAAIPAGARHTLRLAARDDEDHVVIAITDRERRIPDDALPRLFEMFGRNAGVSGLALAICHKIARAAGGEVTATSTDADGTTFTVRLPRGDRPAKPRAVTPAPPAPAPEPPKPVEAAPPRTAQILIVDDDQLVGKALRRILSAHKTVVALSGVEARGILEPNPGGEAARDFDLILCDLMMPDSTGVELHAWLRTHRPELATRMVFMTGGTFTPETERFVDELRVLPVLSKPFEIPVVERVVRDELAKRR